MTEARHYWVNMDGKWHRAWFDNVDTDCGLPITDLHFETNRDEVPAHERDSICPTCRKLSEKKP